MSHVAPPTLIHRPETRAVEPAVVCEELQQWFGQEVHLWDRRTRRCLHGISSVAEAICESPHALTRVYQGNLPDFIAEEPPILILALPLAHIANEEWVAIVPVHTSASEPNIRSTAVARLLGVDPRELATRLSDLPVWSTEAAQHMAFAYLTTSQLQQDRDELAGQLDASCDRLASSFEEITLFHRLTQNLSVSRQDEELGRQTIEWILEYLPATGCALRLLPPPDAAKATYETRLEPLLLQTGEVPFSAEELAELTQRADLAFGCGPCLMSARDSAIIRHHPQVGELLLCPICDRSRMYGCLILVNAVTSPPFSAKDSNLLSSLSSILGTHCGNHELYRQQNEFLAGVVRALTSAIDAKDRYTCGHSDRVARIAVRLGREMGCSSEDLHTIYMSGLLHDIGKIGINDAVLQKHGQLTEDEFEHIKQHPQLGFNILADLEQLVGVLPVVLHHHEQWDGRGYPAGLAKEEIPLLARITSVADAFDAMTSSRPYREGLPVERVTEILREGAGRQWDPQVVAAFFSAYDDILKIIKSERECLTLDVTRWLA